jgi:outer membrane receptor protein involved in Fe transport
LFATAGAAPLLSGVAHAQTSASSTAPEASTEVKEMIVTATRRASSINKVPESISAFSAAKMDVLGVKSFADLAKFTPGVTYDEDRHDIAIRGITSKAGSGTTGIYLDDTPIQMRALGLNANNTLPAVFDMDRVEVLRGPQGTLFGAGSEGGTVRYIMAQPSLTTYSGFAHSELATTEGGAPSYEAGAAFGGPIIPDVLGFRVSAWGRRDGGYINRVDFTDLATTDKDANRVDTFVLRGALTWRPVQELTVTPSINYEKRDQHNYDNYWVAISDPSAGKYLSGTPDRMADPDRFYLPAIKVEYKLPGMTFISNSSYYDRRERVNGYSGTLYNLSYFQQIIGGQTFGYPSDPQGNPCGSCGSLYPLLTPTGPNLPGFGKYVSQNIITNTQQNFTQEFRLQSDKPTFGINWVAGVFYAYNTQRSTEEIRDPQLNALSEYLWGEDIVTAWGEALLPNGDDYINDTLAHDHQVALFVDGTANLTDKLKLTAGVRYAWTHFDFNNVADGPQELSGGPVPAAGAKNETPFTPKFGVEYQATRDDLIYATISKGYRIGGATPPLPPQACGGVFPTSYNSDTTLSYELGTKDRFFGRTLQVSASAYYIQWKNIQQAVYVPTCGIQYTANLGDAVSKGLDLQATWQATHALSFDLSAGYTDAKFTTDSIVAGSPIALKGDALDVAPFTATLGAEYRFNVLNHDGFLRGDWEFTAKRTTPIPAEDPNTVYYDAGLVPNPPVHQVSLRAGLALAKWDLALFAENLLDAHPQLNLQHQDQYTTLYEAETLRPRTVGISANYKF